MKYAKLRGAIREKFRTQGAFARAIGMHPTTLSQKLAGRVDWTREEIKKACQLLGIPAEQLYAYFFAH